jgi:fatty aldehyde-generating acyl-ACP reductase
MELPEWIVYRKIIQTGHFAGKLGVQLPGLSAFMSVVSDAGTTISRAFDDPVTTGDSYMIATAVEAIWEAARGMDIPIKRSSAAVVGVTGSITLPVYKVEEQV